ncbi:MAG: TonB-dependent receptor [Phenylobacterium sp.]
MKIPTLLLSASVLALGYGGAAVAQTRSGASVEAQVQELVVTAERRNTSVMKTPIAATVLSGEDLERKGITSVDQLMFAMPSLTFNNFGQGADFNIRGIGKAEHNTQTTTGVITYRDGVATFPGYFQGEPYYDIASIEVLRGPQGTFVGQNATGGAVLVNSKNPVIGGGVNGYLQGQVGNYNDVGLQGGINLPINDTLAARFSFHSEGRDSFYDISGPWTGNPGDLRTVSLRVGLLWQPTDALKVLWKTDASVIDMGSLPADPVLATNDPFELTANSYLRAKDQLVRSTVRADYVFGNGITLRSTSGFQRGQTLYATDLDGTGAAVGGTTFRDKVEETIYSQEFNLISPDDGPITWVAGAYYQHDKYNFPTGELVIGLQGFDYIIEGTNPKETLAGFGQASFNLPSNFELQVGLRYTTSRTTNHVRIRMPQFGISLPDEQTLRESKVTGKVALNWTPDDHNFFYGFVATGFRPGGLNLPASLVLPEPFRAETVTNYELGWKRGWLDGRVRTQIDAYYNHYKNFQVIIGNPTNPTASTELNNPSATKMYGFEAQVEANFGALSVDAGLGIMESELGTFFAVDPRVPAVGVCNRLTGPATTSCIDLSGHKQTYAPELTVNVGGQYVFTLANGDTITPRLNYGHVATQWATLFENPARGDRIGARNLFGAQLAWTHGDIITTLYSTNLTDQHYVGALNSGLRFMGPPRQYGVRVLKIF